MNFNGGKSLRKYQIRKHSNRSEIPKYSYITYSRMWDALDTLAQAILGSSALTCLRSAEAIQQ